MQNAFKSFIELAEKKQYNLYGLHVYHQGNTLFEHRFRSDDRENLYSGSKTFTAVGIGIAESEGLLKLSDRVLDYFPEHKSIAASGSEELTIRHLLKMSSGHGEEPMQLFNVKERSALFFEAPLIHAPGAVFAYENQCTYMLGRVVEKASGQNMLTYLKPRVFDKLEIPNPQWHTCAMGHTLCSSGLYLKTEEYARLGITLLQNGMYKGREVVSKDFVKLMETDLVATLMKEDPESNQGYGYQVWKCTPRNSFRMDGMYGQISVILRDQEMVITFTGHYEENTKDILRDLWELLLIG